jgi:hypothetical protein
LCPDEPNWDPLEDVPELTRAEEKLVKAAVAKYLNSED